MAPYLHKIGAAIYKHPWRVVAVWVIVLAILGVSAHHFMTPTSSAITIPGTEAQRAIDRSQKLFPGSGKGSGRIVFAAKDSTTIADYKQAIGKLKREVATIDGVSSATSPFAQPDVLISKDGTIAYMPVQLNGEVGSVAESTLSAVRSDVATARTHGLQIETGGGLVSQTPGEILGGGEVIGLVVALVVLLMTLGSLIAAGMPLLTAVTGVAVGTAGLFACSQLFTISTTTPVLAVMLGLAVGIDYSLFIINKYRMLVLEGYTPESAVGRALATAGNAVVFAAATVVIALAALSVVQIPFMTTMGLAGASSIAIAALVALTLVPALLRFSGMKLFSKRVRAKALAAQKRGRIKGLKVNHQTFWYKWGHAITRYPWLILVSAVVVIVVIALPARDLKLGLPTDEYSAQSTTQHKAYQLMARGFGVGYNGPLAVVVEGLPAVNQADKMAIRKPAEQALHNKIAAAEKQQTAYFQRRAAAATTLSEQQALQNQIATAKAEGAAQRAAAERTIDQKVAQYAKYVQLKKVADKIAQLADVQTTVPAQVITDGTAGLIQVIPKSAPSDQATTDLIHDLRSTKTIARITSGNGARVAVTGATALQNDINNKLAAALPEYLAVVVGLSLLLLIVAFRSILIPIKATLGFLLSVLAMFGAVVAVFQWGWFGVAAAPGPIISFIPIISIGVLFGLAMDYEFFLVSSMHEEYTHTHDPKQAVVDGFAAGSKVVTAAGVIMISVFAGFITNHDATIQAIGFGLAFGILVDAFLVRMTIVPAVMTIIGRSAWWLPRWLDKIVPHISIEGEDEAR